MKDQSYPAFVTYGLSSSRDIITTSDKFTHHPALVEILAMYPVTLDAQVGDAA